MLCHCLGLCYCGRYICIMHGTVRSSVESLITKYGSTLYVGMDEVVQHHAHTFEKSHLNFHFQCEFSSVATEW